MDSKLVLKLQAQYLVIRLSGTKEPDGLPGEYKM